MCCSGGALTNLFFPDGSNNDVNEAKRICRKCPVIDQCLQWALDTDEKFGVWGGTSERERRRLRRLRRIERLAS